MKRIECRPIPACRGCRGLEIEPVFQMDPMPLAGMFCLTQAEALSAPVFPFHWVECQQCGLIQVLEDVDDTALFQQYNYSSSSVPGLVRHFESYANFLVTRYGNATSLNFLEIGCNDGVLLNRLPSCWQLSGVDPSDVARASLTGRYQLYNSSFCRTFVRENRLAGSIDIISGSNCLAHMSDLKDIFEAVYAALRDGGHFWLEVHDLQALLQTCQWDTIYHEHKAEWSEESLANCLLPLGFSHVETRRPPLHGGLLRVCFRKEAAAQPAPRGRNRVDRQLAGLRAAYQNRYDTSAASRLRKARQQGLEIAAYGASGRANVYLNQLKQLHFNYVVDDSPKRVDRHLPQTGTPVVPPLSLQTNPVHICLVTAWNYKEEIVQKNPRHQGEWLIAFGET